MLSPNGRVIMISGGSRGIGRAAAERLLASGFHVSIGARDPAKVHIPGADPKRLQVQRYDAREAKDAPAWIAATLARFGRIDGLINAAGINLKFEITDEDESALDEVMLVNLKGPIRLTRAALPHFAKGGAGRVINIASMSGKRVKNPNAGYAMSKFALVAFTHAVRRWGWDKGVRATAVCPSFVNTDMSAPMTAMPKDDMTQPEDLAALIENLLLVPNNAVVAELLVNCRLEDML